MYSGGDRFASRSETDYHEVFCRFPQFLQANVGTSTHIRPWSAPATQFPIHYPIIRRYIARVTALLHKLQINKTKQNKRISRMATNPRCCPDTCVPLDGQFRAQMPYPQGSIHWYSLERKLMGSRTGPDLISKTKMRVPAGNRNPIVERVANHIT